MSDVEKLKPGMFVLSEDARQFVARFSSLELAMPMIEEAYTIGPPKAKKWFVVYTAPKCERKAEGSFKAAGWRSYIPVTTDWGKKSKKKVDQKKRREKLVRPLLTRYVMVELPVHTRAVGGEDYDEVPFGLVRMVDGVQEIVGTPAGPITLSAEVVDAIREREASGEFDATVKRGRVIVPKGFNVGVQVRLEDGPFQSFYGMIRECLPNARIIVDVDIFGRETPVELELAQVALT